MGAIPAALGLLALLWPAERETQRKALVGRAPPELVGRAEHWLGRTPGMTMAQLKGSVVWLQFNF